MLNLTSFCPPFSECYQIKCQVTWGKFVQQCFCREGITNGTSFCNKNRSMEKHFVRTEYTKLVFGRPTHTRAVFMIESSFLCSTRHKWPFLNHLEWTNFLKKKFILKLWSIKELLRLLPKSVNPSPKAILSLLHNTMAVLLLSYALGCIFEPSPSFKPFLHILYRKQLYRSLLHWIEWALSLTII